MKARPRDFLSAEHINHNSEVFDYIAELHSYLWQFVRVALPGAGEYLNQCVDRALDTLGPEVKRLRAERDADRMAVAERAALLMRMEATRIAGRVIEQAGLKIGSAIVDDIRNLNAAAVARRAVNTEDARDKMLDALNEMAADMSRYGYQQIIDEARCLVNGDDVPLWAVAAALQLGYAGESVIMHVASIVLKWHDMYAVKLDGSE